MTSESLKHDPKDTPVIMDIQYQCAKCRRAFPTPEKAFVCWESHRVPVGFESESFYYGYGINYPDTIVIQFDDGQKVEYAYRKEIKNESH